MGVWVGAAATVEIGAVDVVLETGAMPGAAALTGALDGAAVTGDMLECDELRARRWAASGAAGKRRDRLPGRRISDSSRVRTLSEVSFAPSAGATDGV